MATFQQATNEADLNQAIIQRLSVENEQLKQALAIEVANRRQLHNELYESKGNIRVIARVRPLTKSEEARQEQAKTFTDPKSNSVCVLERATGKTIRVPFDRALSAASTQDEVFDEVRPLVQSVLDGYSACIFAYGQTGSGKTFTMTGTPQQRGVSFRMVHDLFQVAQKRAAESPGATFSFQLSVFEIYNECLRDLLNPQDEANKEIKVDPETGLKVVFGATRVVPSSFEEAWTLIERGVRSRSVASTDMNANSSRSHLIIMIDVQGFNPAVETGFTRSRLCLTDLAGSERQAESGAQGQNLKEASQINSSLSVLSRVINSLAQKSKIAPPYRESKLTYLLQDALSGQSKTVMFVQVSPIESSISQTLQTLQFASRVKSIELSPNLQSRAVDHVRAIASLKKQHEDELENMRIMHLQKEAELHLTISTLRAELEAHQAQAEISGQEIAQLRAIIQQQHRQNEQLMNTIRAGVASAIPPSLTQQRVPLSPISDIESPSKSYKRTPMPSKRKSRSPMVNEIGQPPAFAPITPIKMGDVQMRGNTPSHHFHEPQSEQDQIEITEDNGEYEDADAILNSFVEDYGNDEANSEMDCDDDAMEVDTDNKENSSQMASNVGPLFIRVISKPTMAALKSCFINKQAATLRSKKRVRFPESLLAELSPDVKRRAIAHAGANTPSYQHLSSTPRFHGALARRPANVLPPTSPYRLSQPMKGKNFASATHSSQQYALATNTQAPTALGAPGRRPVSTANKTPMKAKIAPGGLNRTKLVL